MGEIKFFLIISTVISYIYNQWTKINQIAKINKNRIDKLEEDLKDIKSLFELDKRIAIMENLIDRLISKKAQVRVDPRIVIWIALIILLLLFLKITGIFG